MRREPICSACAREFECGPDAGLMHGGRNNFVVAGGQYREAKEGGSCLRRGNFFRVTLRTSG